jgi:hypothetical protein
LIEDPRFELVAVGVSNDEKVGRDAGELAGLDVVTGVTGHQGHRRLIAARPDCLVYTAMGDVRTKDATLEVCAALEAGINVVGSAPGGLQFRGAGRSRASTSKGGIGCPARAIRPYSSPASIRDS